MRGPFVEITNGTITPAHLNSIDSTFYVDPDGQPWMIFVNEWPNFEDKIGKMAVAKLSDDLTCLISEPIDLFKASEPKWTGGRNVTDGCFMYTTKKGSLLMIWSNFDDHGYAVGIAKSTNNKIDGKWIHEDKALYSKSMNTKYDGGHGMIFTDTDGQKYLCIHTPTRHAKKEEKFLHLFRLSKKTIHLYVCFDKSISVTQKPCHRMITAAGFSLFSFMRM